MSDSTPTLSIDTLVFDDVDGSLIGTFSSRGFGLVDEVTARKIMLKKNCVLNYNSVGGKIYNVDTNEIKRSWIWPKFGTLGQSVNYRINKSIVLHGGNVAKLP